MFLNFTAPYTISLSGEKSDVCQWLSRLLTFHKTVFYGCQFLYRASALEFGFQRPVVFNSARFYLFITKKILLLAGSVMPKGS